MRSASIHPSNLTVQRSAGTATAQSTRLAHTLAPYEAALRKDPRRIDVLNAAASLCLQAGDLARGIAYLDASLGVQPDQATIHR